MAGRPTVTLSVPQNVEAAPIPPQIGSAETAFIANGGEERLTDIKEKTTYQSYNDFYATMKNWGRYELVSAPSQSDLVLQMSQTNSTIRLAIIDSKTHVALWDLSQNIHGVSRGTVQLKDLNAATAALVKSLAKLASQPAAEISVPTEINSPPVPLQISGSRKVFLSRSIYENGPNELYSRWYADMRSWGRYELTTPGEADLIFEPSAPDGWVRLTIRDAKTRIVLWTFTEPVKSAFLSGNAAKNSTAALSLLMDDVHHVLSLRAPPSRADATKREQNVQK